VLRLPTFEVLNRVALTVHQLVRRAQQQNLRALIVDVRDNPGGVDVEFVASAGAFLNELYYVVETRQSTTSRLWRNGVVYVADSTGVPITPLYSIVALSGQASWKGRMAVLVNANSYSGAEYFAQAIQDAKRGVVIGEATGGLGNTVTTQYDLQDGSAVALTLGRSLRRDGTPLPERVTPDVVVKDDLDVLAATGRDIVLERAVELVSAR
jgi:carboxyl-terminal processing protease